MILPRGVTGFWSVNAAPLPLLDEKAFCQMCYSIALENGGTVTELDTDTYPRNFYSVKLSRHDQSVFVLQNIHYPYAAFAQRDASGRFVLTQQPEWIRLLESPVQFLRFDELNQVLQHGGVDRIMLDNFTPENTRKAVEMIDGRFETESSGGITFDTLRQYAECGADFISVGALTHSVKSLDMSFKAVK